jgi:hypothetical protein
LLAQLSSESEDQRRFAWAAMQLAFPEDARRMSDFDPKFPLERAR